jgi:class 3 adenylate cyclase
MISMKEAVIMLNGVFEHIDDMLMLHESLEKIKTITSKILIVGGINNTSERFLEQMTDLALNLVEYFSEPKEYDVENETISVRLDMGFGIAYGPIVAGIVGKKKFVYEIYGDVVNTASRMCSLAKGSDIVVTEKCFELLDESNSFFLGTL